MIAGKGIMLDKEKTGALERGKRRRRCVEGSSMYLYNVDVLPDSDGEEMQERKCQRSQASPGPQLPYQYHIGTTLTISTTITITTTNTTIHQKRYVTQASISSLSPVPSSLSPCRYLIFRRHYLQCGQAFGF
ncbi:hypothetical protein E2C01_096158 [Portunus trituberculatus]|uniref:Uncharacterized protein n=1 Tax=Portunus trituberculatus TaxID=210409 RepID=A0A5B7K139_PORTR|nr:hypothetical protein [Portunus trituberculatus]